MGLVLASAGFGMLTAPIMELHNQKGYFLHHIIFACCTLICIICILLLPEPRSKPLPETLPDGESYTREPLLQSLRHRENSHLLPQSQSGKDYSRVCDTPLHEVGTAVVSTMESTASSAIELTAQMHGGVAVTMVTEVQASKSEPKDPNGHSVSSSSPTSAAELGKDSVICASKERLLSSSPAHKAPCATDPLLSDEEPFAIVLNSIEPKVEYIPRNLKSPTAEVDSAPAASTDPHVAPETVSPVDDSPPPLEPPSDLNIPLQSEAPAGDSQLDISSPCPPSPQSLSPVPSPRVDSGHDEPSADSAPPPKTQTMPPSILPVTDIVHPPDPTSLTPTDCQPDPVPQSVAGPDSSWPAPPSLIECTVSSPIDSGVPLAKDGGGAATESDSADDTIPL